MRIFPVTCIIRADLFKDVGTRLTMRHTRRRSKMSGSSTHSQVQYGIPTTAVQDHSSCRRRGYYLSVKCCHSIICLAIRSNCL